jgi:hypothetical protein
VDFGSRRLAAGLRFEDEVLPGVGEHLSEHAEYLYEQERKPYSAGWELRVGIVAGRRFEWLTRLAVGLARHYPPASGNSRRPW